MILTWHGNSFLKIQTKEVLIFVNPNEQGLARFKFDILLDSYFKDYPSIKDKVFLINNPGEYDVKNIFIRGILVNNSDKKNIIIYTMDVDDIKICYLSSLNNSKLTDEQLDFIGSSDVLIVPVGGKVVLDGKSAYNLVNKIEPKIVIPIYYKIPKISPNLNSLENFLSFFSKKDIKEVADKLTLKKKDLPQEGQIIMILKTSYK